MAQSNQTHQMAFSYGTDHHVHVYGRSDPRAKETQKSPNSQEQTKKAPSLGLALK
jgi:hypothetical protein